MENKKLSVSQLTIQAMLDKQTEQILKGVEKIVSKSNAPVVETKAIESKPSKESKKSPKAKSNKTLEPINFVLNIKERTIGWASWIDHDEQFVPMDEIAQKYNATRKGKKYTFKTAKSANGFWVDIQHRFPDLKYKQA